MPHLIRFAAPPMIARRRRQDIKMACPGHRLSPPSTHFEMLEATRSFGHPGDDAAITVSAYPQLLERIWSDGVPAADLSVLGLPPLRREWAGIGLMPPIPTLRVIAVVPFVLAVGRTFARFVRDWDDLRPLLREPGRIGVPPLDTPLPFLLSAELQDPLSGNGGMAPVVAGINGFAELEAARWRLIWPGWEMNACLATA